MSRSYVTGAEMERHRLAQMTDAAQLTIEADRMGSLLHRTSRLSS